MSRIARALSLSTSTTKESNSVSIKKSRSMADKAKRGQLLRKLHKSRVCIDSMSDLPIEGLKRRLTKAGAQVVPTLDEKVDYFIASRAPGSTGKDEEAKKSRTRGSRRSAQMIQKSTNADSQSRRVDMLQRAKALGIHILTYTEVNNSLKPIESNSSTFRVPQVEKIPRFRSGRVGIVDSEYRYSPVWFDFSNRPMPKADWTVEEPHSIFSKENIENLRETPTKGTVKKSSVRGGRKRKLAEVYENDKAAPLKTKQKKTSVFCEYCRLDVEDLDLHAKSERHQKLLLSDPAKRKLDQVCKKLDEEGIMARLIRFGVTKSDAGVKLSPKRTQFSVEPNVVAEEPPKPPTSRVS